MKRSKALLLRAMIEKSAVSLDDGDALEAVELFPKWAADTAYEVGCRVSFSEKLYKCIQNHTSQTDWIPPDTPALWTEVSIEEWPEWRQPLGAQDAYNTGDKVSHNEKHWVSTMDANVYEPGVYGWEEQT